MGDTSQEELLFEAALAIDEPEARAAFLDQACSHDSELRGAIEKLLAFHGSTGSVLDRPALEFEAEDEEQPGAELGRYRIIERIGEGGFGAVYRAEQLDPVRRDVAVKILKPGMDSREILARFDAERQALALMSHPHIATVFDAGVTPRGRPYFVMELVAGRPIDEHCDAERLSVRDRLRLFISVCRAVQHAHQKGVVHRDLKPSNVLVTPDGPGGASLPKVIDFGVAKAIKQPTTDAVARTQLHLLIGTPEYMSPEQLAGANDVDTRSDIYALGGMLYKLLTSVTPLDHRGTNESSFEEICRMIRTVDPVPPSKRLLQLDGQLPSIAEARGTNPAGLVRAIRGDLDWIVMKALEKDRSRRYETASEFALDIERHLDEQPVVAGPPSRWYIARKFIRRNRMMVTAATVGLAALGLGGMLAGIGFVHAEHQRVHAEREWARAEEERVSAEQARERAIAAGREAEQARAAMEVERQGALAAAEKAQRVAALLEQLLDVARPEHGRRADYSVRQLLDDFAHSFDRQLEGQPDIEASVRRTLGRSYLGIGDPGRAQPQLERALELRRLTLGDNHRLTAQSKLDFAKCLLLVPKLEQAEQAAQAAIDVLAQLEPSGDLADAYCVLGMVHHEYGNRESNERLTNEAWVLSERLYGRDHRTTIMFQARTAMALATRGNKDRGEELARDAYERLRNLLPTEHPDVGWVTSALGWILSERRRFDESEVLLRQAIEISRKSFGPESYVEAVDLARLAEVLVRTDRRDEAESLARQAVSISERATVGQTTLRSWTHHTLASVLQTTKPAEAAEHWAKAVELRQQAVGDQPEVGRLLTRQANVLERLGRFDEAADCLRDALAIRQKRPEARIALSGTFLRLAEAHREAGRRDEARDVLREALTVFADKSDLPLNRFILVEALIDLGDLAEAEMEVEQLARTDTDKPLAQAMAIAGRAKLLAAQGEYDTAESQIRQATELLKWRENPRGRFRASLVLAHCLTQTKKFHEAEQLLMRLEQRRDRQFLNPEDVRRLARSFVDLYSAWDKPAQADRWRQRILEPFDE